MAKNGLDGRTIIGLVESVTITQDDKTKTVKARIDSGATNSSIDSTLAAQLRLGPVVANKMIKSANGARMRPIVEVEVDLHGKKVKERFTLADRSHMKYRVLIGQNILKRGFLIDPCQE
ncbi:hypothetical protein GOV07_02050 [Candidatus Woesearchaeota archaeon]|nr:hypothetical protein [Candidatus Woesearchaeota archaeon]